MSAPRLRRYGFALVMVVLAPVVAAQSPDYLDPELRARVD